MNACRLRKVRKLSAYGSLCVSADETIDEGGGWRGGRVFLYSYWYDEWKRYMKGKKKDDCMSWILLRSSLIASWGCIQRETWRIWPHIFSQSAPETRFPPKNEEIFSKMTATNSKRESTRNGEERVGSWLYGLEYTFYGARATPCLRWL
jgi:hypothetical protein